MHDSCAGRSVKVNNVLMDIFWHSRGEDQYIISKAKQTQETLKCEFCGDKFHAQTIFRLRLVQRESEKRVESPFFSVVSECVCICRCEERGALILPHLNTDRRDTLLHIILVY